MNNSNIIKEFLYHSLSDKQLQDLELFFKSNKKNIEFYFKKNSVLHADIKLLGGISTPLSDNDLAHLKKDEISLLYRNYRGRNYTKIIHLPHE